MPRPVSTTGFKSFFVTSGARSQGILCCTVSDVDAVLCAADVKAKAHRLKV
jgi:hypothetical protein